MAKMKDMEATLEVNSENESYSMITKKPLASHDGDGAGILIADIYDRKDALAILAMWNEVCFKLKEKEK